MEKSEEGLRPKKPTATVKQNEKKWTKELMSGGWTAIPSIILERQDALGLEPIDINIIMQLSRYWWTKDNLPHPSKSTLAKCIGKSESTIRRRIAVLEELGFIKRHKRYNSKGSQISNFYSFEGLIEEATPYATEFMDQKQKQRKENQKRIKRKKPVISS